MKLPKVKYWYHATTLEAAEKIRQQGQLRPAIDGIYFANTNQNASTFMMLRGLSRWAVVRVPGQQLRPHLEISTDHCFAVPDGCHFAVYRGGIVRVTEDQIDIWEQADEHEPDL